MIYLMSQYKGSVSVLSEEKNKDMYKNKGFKVVKEYENTKAYEDSFKKIKVEKKEGVK